ncbi:hypothetical protein LAZ67_5002899 [Cordylochernes scorpioides]|uniref:Reverse transcriptase domain-containing protein n=1 Tax=Cordylochernes scorpioides TaxID=51811 RepID=A0ABY6KGT0_9ARAC|nr:hypothetical protein LAZ67_5002899 [Cordylochernes scorpioides]
MTTTNEVKEVIKNLGNHKAPGHDNITPQMTKNLPIKWIVFIAGIFNAALHLCYFPKTWKNAIIITIPKKSPVKSPEDLRPISLLSTIGKVYERIVLRRLQSYMDSINFIIPQQFGFRKGHSTTHQLITVIDYIQIRKSHKEAVGAVFLDFTKAFDRVWHDGLITKNQFRRDFIKFLKNYLQDRTFSIKQGNYITTAKSTQIGALSLEPYLFNIYINDFPLHPKCQTKLFTDDAAILTNSKSIGIITTQLQNCINSITKWCNDWKLDINPKKSQAIIFPPLDKKFKPQSTLKVNQSPIKWTDSVKYLGVTLDSKFKFNMHVKNIMKKAKIAKITLSKGKIRKKKLQSPTQKDLKILQLNVEGFTRAKGEIIEKIMREHKADVIALQETHTPENSKSAIRIPGYVIICSKPHPKFGLAIYITYKLREETKVLPETSHSIGIQINDLSIYNVYKPPSQLWIPTSLPSPQHPAIVLGDFNSHHTLWGYSSTDNEGESLNDWMEINDMQLIFDAKKQGTFQSARWGKTYSPDLCFVTKDQCDNPIQIAHKILTKFPKSQHCPSIYEMGIQIPQIDSAPIPRWNLGKANWEAFTKYIEDNINLIPPTPKNYSRASNLIISCAKKFIPRGHRKIYIPCWSPESERLYQEYNLSGNTETAENLIRSLDDSRKHRWHTMLEQMDFSKSSRKSWSLLRKLGGADPPHKHNQLTNPNKIATCISSKSRIHPNPSEKSRLKKVIGTNLSKSSTHPQLSTNIDLNEVEDAIKVTHNNRAPGPDGIMPEFMKHLGQKAIKWMAKLFTNILSTGSIPSVIILNRISPIIEEYLPIEQAGFRPGRNCAEQTLALTTTIEDGFQKKLKTGAVFVDLTAAYDTVWREGLLYKLSKIINCKNIIKLINNFLTNRKITVHLNNKKSRPRTLNNGLPQGSVLAPLLFNVYTADIPATNSQKFLYADDIALLHQEQSFSTLEQILNEDLKKLENFFSKWHLIPNPSKTVSSVFHLNNHKANRPLKLTFCNKPLSHDPCPKYLGVTLDRSLTSRQHLEKTRDKLKTRNNIMTRLAGTTWGCGADTLRTTALALVYSVAEYCAPVWERSSHTDSIDAQLNQTMRLITGNMRPTPIDWLPYLSNIAPPDLRRKKSTSNLLSKIKANTKLPINTVLETPPPTRLISRNPAWVADENVDLKEEWRNRWSNLAIANKDLVEDPNTKPPGYNLPRRTWSTLNRIRTSTGRCNYLLNKWNMSPDQNCDCGQIQTMHHILRDCPRRFFQGTLGDIHRCTEEALEWIRHLDIPL